MFTNAYKVDQILDSDNGNISKVVLALSTILDELETLTKEGSTDLIYPLLALTETDTGVSQEKQNVGIARLCTHFQKLLNFSDHCKDVLDNLLSQLEIILTKDKSPVKLTSNKLSTIWMMIGQFLSMVIFLDTSLQHQKLQQFWLQYKRMIKSIRNEPEKHGGNIENIRNLEKILLKLEETVVCGKLFETVLKVKATPGKSFVDEISNFLRLFSSEVEKDLSGDKFLVLISLTVLARHLTGQYVGRQVTKCWDIARKLPACACVSRAGVVWTPESFFSKHLAQTPEHQSSQEKKNEAAVEAARKSWFTQRLNTLGNDVSNLANTVKLWLVKIQSLEKKNLSNIQLSELGDISSIIFQGIDLATVGQNILNQCINFHVKLDHPLTKSAITNLAQLMAAVKHIQVIAKIILTHPF